jgi:hypothetical protein
MDERYIEKSAADILLGRGVDIPCKAPFFLRWFGKKNIRFKVYRPYYGTGLRISSYYLSTGITDQQLESTTAYSALVLHSKEGKVISKIVACGILNDWFLGFMFTGILAWYLREYCTEERMCAMSDFLIVFGTTKPFMNTIRSVHKLVITAPNLSQPI